MLTRREMIRYGMLSAPAVAILDSLDRKTLLWAESGTPRSPHLTPFKDEMPIPPVLGTTTAFTNEIECDIVEDHTFEDEAPRSKHQKFADFQTARAANNVDLCEVHQLERPHSFHSDAGDSLIWGYNGIFPGPTLTVRYGRPCCVRSFNNLPANHVGFGLPSTTTHFHNMHTPSESDGFPGDFVDSGFWKDNIYPMTLAGNDPAETMNFLWYHDHRQDFTAANVYKGLAGAAFVFDELDSGDERDPNPAAFHLPSGDFDVPLIFLDPILDPNHQAFFDPFNFNGHIGDLFTVNGKVQPKFSVFRRKYRLRILNIGPSRFYQVSFSNKMPFQQISTDGNLLPAPITVNSLLLSVAERADIIVDFSKFNKGDQLFLLNTLEQVDGRGPTGKQLNPGIPLLRFDVVGDPVEPDLSQVPNTLRALPTIDLSKVSARRRFEFNRGNGMWTINGQVYSGTDERVKIPQGSAEIWTLKNGGGGWSHPIHIHFEEFQILSRNGGQPLLQERGRKDVARLGPGEEVEIFIQFRDYLGQYVMHCHNVVHEDHAMMLRFQIV